jgi:AcrR family transcriptional regulator
MRPVNSARASRDTSGGADGAADSLQIRPPRQARTQQAWNRVLNSGVEILEEGGYDAFTIAAVCERARVPPRALYDRVTSKDALFLAVYEHGMARVAADHAPFANDSLWEGLGPAATIGQAVRLVMTIFDHHAALLRAVVLLPSAHPEVLRRGAHHTQQLRELYVQRCRPAVSGQHADPATAAGASFDAVFASAVFRTAYGPSFLRSGQDADDHAARLAEMQAAYLIAGRPG